jgi:hypothetical protein
MDAQLVEPTIKVHLTEIRMRFDKAAGIGLDFGGAGEVRFGAHSGLKSDIARGLKSADIVAEVENRRMPKISQKLIFRRLYRCNAV